MFGMFPVPFMSGAPGGPIVDYDFIGSGALPSGFTFTRSTVGWDFDSGGNIVSNAIDAPRFDYNPSTLAARGLLLETSANVTNAIRNNTILGAGTGTPGTLPTNWVDGITAGFGLTRTINAVSSENGIDYIEIRWNGTTGGAGTFYLSFDADNNKAGTVGQAFVGSAFYRQTAGNTSGLTLAHVIREFDNIGPTQITVNATNITGSIANTAMRGQRYFNAYTLPSAGAAFVNTAFSLTSGAGQAVDFTIRIGLPQLEGTTTSTAPSSVIKTTGAAATRNIDACSMTGASFSAWFTTPLTIIFELELETGKSAAETFYSISNGTTNDAPQYVFSNLGASFRYDSINGGATQATITVATVPTANTVYKLGVVTAVNDFRYCVNGTLGTPDVGGTISALADRLRLGVSPTGSNGVNMWVRRMRVYPYAMDSAVMQALTT